MDNFYVHLWHDMTTGNGCAYAGRTMGSSILEDNGQFMPGDKDTFAVTWLWNPILGMHW